MKKEKYKKIKKKNNSDIIILITETLCVMLIQLHSHYYALEYYSRFTLLKPKIQLFLTIFLVVCELPNKPNLFIKK